MTLPAGPLTAATHSELKKANPQTGALPMCDAETVATAVADGEYAMLSQDPATRGTRVLVVGGVIPPGAGRDAIHPTFTNAALAGGTSTQVVHTATLARYTKIQSVVARYVGTVLGVTLQLQAGTGVRADVAAAGLVSGQDVNLLGPGREVYLDPGELLEVVVTGATAGDDLIVHIQGEEMTV